MKEGPQEVLVGGVLVALLVPWAVTTLLWLGNPLLLPSDLFQFSVFALVFTRTLLYVGIPELRRLSWGATIILFSGDSLILPAAGVLSVVTGSSSEFAFASSYVASWFSASLVVYPPVAAYVIANAFRARGRLAFVLPAAACCYTISTLVMIAIESPVAPHGLTGILGSALVGIRHPVLPSGWTLEVITFSGAILFVSLAAYAVIGRRDAEWRLAPQLSLGVVGAIGALAWLMALPHLSPLLLFGLPTLVVLSVVWVTSRGS